jgi:hypothetical protein
VDGSAVALPTYTTKTSTAMTTITHTIGGTSGHDILMRQWWSAPLTPGQTMANTDTLSYVIRTQESNALANCFVFFGLNFWVESIGASWNGGYYGATETATTLVSKARTASAMPYTFTTQAGDRVFIELGYQKNSTVSYTNSFRIGDTGATDLTLVDGTATDNVPWVEYSRTLTFEPEAGNSNQLMMTGVGT